jgi:ATP/maltotriose-dependent transcriptional regulator MalT
MAGLTPGRPGARLPGGSQVPPGGDPAVSSPVVGPLAGGFRSQMDVSTEELSTGSVSPILVRTKLFRPQPGGRTLARERLIERLRHGSGGRRLTLVAAPGGYGKTILLSSWVDTEEERPVAWVSIDDRDDDPVVLWAHIIESLRQVSSGPCRELSPELARSASLAEIGMPRLINALAGEDELSLVLDGFHHLRARAAKDSVEWFVANAPRNLQIVVSSRSEPDLPLPAMRVHGELLEIRADDLRFTEDEATAWLNDELGLGLPSEDVAMLMRRTEGWPAGLYLASLSIPRAADVHEFVDRFGASSRYVAEFLLDEVLGTYESDVQTFMLRTSILDRMCGALCDAVLGGEGSEALLRRLARSNLFLFRLDDEGTWYRFHSLFSQLLQVELDRREPGASASLHRRAFDWFLANGRHEEAIDHAIDGGAFGEASDVIAATWPVAANAGRFATVTGLIGRLPEPHRDSDVRLRLAEAWVLSTSGRREEARRAIAAVEAMPGARTVPLLDGFSSVESSLTMLRAVFPDGDHGIGMRAAQRAVDLEKEGSPWRAVACSAMGRDYYYEAEFDEADRWLDESYALAPGSGQWLTAVTALAYRSLIAGAQGRDADRRAIAERAVQLARDHGLETVAGPPHLAVAVSSLEEGHAERARAHAEEGVAVLRRWGQPLMLAHALLLLTQISRVYGDYGGAASALHEARAIIEGCPDPGIFLAARLAELTPSSTLQEGTGTDDLTERELAVLRLLRGSLSEREIGNELFLTHNTIHSHTRSIYRKLGVSSRAEAVEAARSRGLL